MTSRIKQFVVITCLVLLIGCAGNKPAPESHIYLLRADNQLPDGVQTAPVDVGIGRVVLANYLGQSGIVLQTGPDEIRAARQHLWAEPLEASLRLYMRDAVSVELGYPVSGDSARRTNWDYRIDMVFDQLHGSLEGQVVIDASWVVLDGSSGKQLLQQRFRRSVKQSTDGYDALVTAQKDLLNDLAAAVATSFSNIDSSQ
ncbi:MAG: PqiC family protein [Gammaproteobacteria bacterium]